MSNPYQTQTDYQPPRRRVWPFALLGCFGVLLFVVVGCAGLIFYGYRKVAGEGEVAADVDRLFSEIAAGRASDYYRHWTAPALKRASSEDEFVELARLINKRLGKLQSKSIVSFNVGNYNLITSIDVIYEGEFERGNSKIQASFEHDNHRWLLHSFHVNLPPEQTNETGPEKIREI